MKKILVHLLCCFIPSKSARRSIRARFLNVKVGGGGQANHRFRLKNILTIAKS
ncbi:MAG: hypothetical protein LBH29_05390 [Elusimicrobiota bacterium]|nr:hypothetical protein [Elusimicrobiota bacterium]